MLIQKIKRRIFLFTIALLKYTPFMAAMRIRNLCYKFVLKKMGEHTNIADGVTITCPMKVSVGSRVSIHEYTFIGSAGEVTIGDGVMIGTDCSIISDAHNFSERSVPMRKQGHTAKPVIIGNDVWLGCKVTVLGGVKINDGAIIGAGSVVTKDIPPYAIAMGVPCRVKRFRGEKKQQYFKNEETVC